MSQLIIAKAQMLRNERAFTYEGTAKRVIIDRLILTVKDCWILELEFLEELDIPTEQVGYVENNDDARKKAWSRVRELEEALEILK